jgi:uncharacterized protein (DUF2141 family)
MRTLLIITILTLQLNILNAQNSELNTLTINFEITTSDQGQMLFALYDSEANHMENTFKTAEVKIENGKAQVIVRDLKSGYYSFSYFHDVNSNGELDTNLVGIPKEPYGFSNGEKGRLGPPDFEDCKIKIDKDITLKINIE